MTMMPPRAFTHVVESNGGELISLIGRNVDRERFAGPLRRKDGRQRWGMGLMPLPDDLDYDEMIAAGQDFDEYLQAAGSAEALSLEIRKTGGAQWGCRWVRYVVGHPHAADLPLDVTIEMGISALQVSAAEVFDAEEAADLFVAYHRSGDIPDGYSLRPVQGWGPDDSPIDIYHTEPSGDLDAELAEAAEAAEANPDAPITERSTVTRGHGRSKVHMDQGPGRRR
jgi:hypothetical protein